MDPHMDEQKSYDLLKLIYNSSVLIQNTGAMDNRDGGSGRESGKSMLAARQDDDDDYVLRRLSRKYFMVEGGGFLPDSTSLEEKNLMFVT